MICASLAGFASESSAEILPVTLDLKQTTVGYLQPLDGYTSVGSTTDLQLGLAFNQNFDATGFNGKLVPWVREDAPYSVGGDQRANRTFLELSEGWLEVVRDNWDFRAGNQLISWGSADGFNPTDVWNSSDSIDPFDQTKLPLLLARLAIHPLAFDHFIFEVVGGPQFRPDRLPVKIGASGEVNSVALTDSRWLIPSPSLVRISKNNTVPVTYHVDGADQPQDLQIGARLRIVRLSGWDMAFTASQTTIAMPAIGVSTTGQIDQPTLPIDITLKPVYYRANTYGFDLNGTLGPVGIRLDVATRSLVDANSVTGNASGVAPTSNEGIVGFDYTLVRKKSEFYVNLSYVQKDNPVRSGSGAVGGASGNSSGVGLGVPNFEPWDKDIVALLEARFLQHAKLGARSITSLVNHDAWISPYASYIFSERYTIEFGVDTFIGSSTGTFGQYADNNRFCSALSAQF